MADNSQCFHSAFLCDLVVETLLARISIYFKIIAACLAKRGKNELKLLAVDQLNQYHGLIFIVHSTYLRTLFQIVTSSVFSRFQSFLTFRRSDHTRVNRNSFLYALFAPIVTFKN